MEGGMRSADSLRYREEGGRGLGGEVGIDTQELSIVEGEKNKMRWLTWYLLTLTVMVATANLKAMR